MIIGVDLYSSIRTRYTEGESIRSIAKGLGISRQTVKKYCQGSTHPEVRKTYQRESEIVNDDVKSFISSCFKEDEAENLESKDIRPRRFMIDW